MSLTLLERLRPEIRELRGYSSARMEASGGAILLNANESPWPVDDKQALNRYPDPQPAVLLERLAGLYGVNSARLLVGRGSDEPIDLLTRAFCRAGQDAIVIAPPTFGMYRVAADIQGARVIEVPLSPGPSFALDAAGILRAAQDDAVKLVYVCTPNNPTGSVTSRETILALAEQLRGRALLVVDEAYVEFSAMPSLAADAGGVENLAVLRTLSKAHALAAARIGTLIAHPELIAVLRRLLAPYPLPAPCVAAALQALSEQGQVAARLRIERVLSQRQRLRAALADIDGVVEVFGSAANFIAVRLQDSEAAYRRLLAAGVVVRNIAHYPGLAGCLRLTVGSADENDALLAALADVAAPAARENAA